MFEQRRVRSGLFCALIVLTWAIGLILLARAAGGAQSAVGFNVPLWIVRHLSRSLLNPVARDLGAGYVPASDSELSAFLSDASRIAAAERDVAYAEVSASDPRLPDADLRQRIQATEALDEPVEARLSSELTSVLAGQGLETTLPVYNHFRFVWPPLNFAYDLPPLLLIESPRRQIELESTALLRSDLSHEQAAGLLSHARSRGDSALIVRLGGLASYPSIVEEDDDYSDAIDLIAHEWTHQYLVFQPLGIRYFQGSSMTTINETVANMAGQELSLAFRARYPLNGTPAVAHSSAPPADPTIDVDQILHQLRLRVDSLLSKGEIDQAEHDMDQTQAFLAQHGYYLPQLNQAYFAFYGTYANTAASSSPFGPGLATLRSRYPSLSAFLHAVQSIRSPGDVNRLLQSSAG